MSLDYIDYVSVSGRSWLHRLPAGVKLAALAGVIGVALASVLVPVPAALLMAVTLIAASARLPMKLFVGLMLYPALFLTVLLLSIGNLTLASVLLLATRVLAITGAVVVLLLTTSYPALFGALSRILPGFLVAALFFTYRSIFVMARSLADARTALHLRGGLDWRHPVASLQRLGAALVHFMVHAIDASQRMADSLRVRGFANRIYYVGKP